MDDRKLQFTIRDCVRNELREANEWMQNFDRRLSVMERELSTWRQLGFMLKQDVPQIKNMLLRMTKNETILEENIIELEAAIGKLEEQVNLVHEDQSDIVKLFDRDHVYQDVQIRRLEGAMNLDPLPRKQVFQLESREGATRQ